MMNSPKQLILVLLLTQFTVYLALSLTCSTVSNPTQCNAGICSNYIWSGSICSLYTAPCPPNYANVSGACTDCTTLSSAQCSTSCPTFSWSLNNITNANGCNPCEMSFGIGCNSCNSTNCNSCITGLTLSSGNSFCYDTNCGISYCIYCINNITCGACSDGYTVVTNFNTTTCVASSCNIKYCTSCSSTTCSSCSKGYVVSSDALKCNPVCPDNCQTCYVPNTCFTCATNFLLNPTTGQCNYDCTKGSVANCFSCSSFGVCDICQPGYVSVQSGSFCSFQNCITNCLSCNDSTTCNLCATGYTFVNGACSKDLCSIDYCQVCGSISTCTTCATNFAFDSTTQKCVPSCAASVTNCVLCSSSTLCIQCSSGFTISPNSSTFVANSTTCYPICSITSCSICSTQTTCLMCISGASLSSDFKACITYCVPNCQTCSGTACSVCNPGFNLSTTGFCSQTCPTGYGLVDPTNTTACISCGDYCLTCTYNSSIKCTSCEISYYISSDVCLACSSSMIGCIECSSAVLCSACKNPYSLKTDSSGCIINDCPVTYCTTCSLIGTTCSSCQPGFTLSNNTCSAPVCPPSSSLVNGVCNCQNGYFNSGTGCSPCSDPNCLSCSPTQCTQCSNKYAASGSSCVPCSINCESCSATMCLVCEAGYTLDYSAADRPCLALGGTPAAIDASGTVYPCPASCDQCVLGELSMTCLVPSPGFYINSKGEIRSCDSKCKTCYSSDKTLCKSCYTGMNLVGTSCVQCLDPQAVTCLKTDPNYSLKCKLGYTLDTASHSCVPCDPNCLQCDLAGAGNCDRGKCVIGFAVYPFTKNCTACISSCSQCKQSNPNTCNSCGFFRYQDAIGVCQPCSKKCKRCTSATSCTGCVGSYVLNGTVCIPGPVFPCRSIDCSICYYGYIPQSGRCVVNTSPGAVGGVFACPLGQYIDQVSQSCKTCNITAPCISCDSTGNCILCADTYYLNNNVCVPCAAHCTTCINNITCLKADTGYYLPLTKEGDPIGTVAICAFPCSTCQYSQDFCITCLDGYFIYGTQCKANKYVSMTAAFVEYDVAAGSVFTANDTADAGLSKCLSQYNRVYNTICQRFKSYLGTCERKLIITNYTYTNGVLTVQMDVDANGFTSESAAISTYKNALYDNTKFDGIQLASAYASATGFSPDTSSGISQSNLGLILGVSIPLGLLLILLLIILCVALKKKEDIYMDPNSESNKELEDAQKI